MAISSDNLIQLLDSKDYTEFSNALQGYSKGKDRKLTKHFVEVITNNQHPETIQALLIQFLGQIGDSSCIGLLKNVISTRTNRWMRRYALFAIGTLDYSKNEEYIVPFLNDIDIWLRRYAMVLIRNNSKNPELLKMLQSRAEIESDEWNRSIIENIEIDPTAQKSKRSLFKKKKLFDFGSAKTEEDKSKLIFILGQSPNKKNLQKLISLFDELDTEEGKLEVLKALKNYKKIKYRLILKNFIIDKLSIESIALFDVLVEIIKNFRSNNLELLDAIRNILEQPLSVDNNLQIEKNEKLISVLGDIGNLETNILLFDLVQNSSLKTFRDLAKSSRLNLSKILGFSTLEELDIESGLKRAIPKTKNGQKIYILEYGLPEEKIEVLESIENDLDFPRDEILRCIFDENAGVSIKAFTILSTREINDNMLSTLKKAFDHTESDLLKLKLAQYFANKKFNPVIPSLVLYYHTSPPYIQARIKGNIQAISGSEFNPETPNDSNVPGAPRIPSPNMLNNNQTFEKGSTANDEQSNEPYLDNLEILLDNLDSDEHINQFIAYILKTDLDENDFAKIAQKLILLNLDNLYPVLIQKYYQEDNKVQQDIIEFVNNIKNSITESEKSLFDLTRMSLIALNYKATNGNLIESLTQIVDLLDESENISRESLQESKKNLNEEDEDSNNSEEKDSEDTKKEINNSMISINWPTWNWHSPENQIFAEFNGNSIKFTLLSESEIIDLFSEIKSSRMKPNQIKLLKLIQNLGNVNNLDDIKTIVENFPELSNMSLDFFGNIAKDLEDDVILDWIVSKFRDPDEPIQIKTKCFNILIQSKRPTDHQICLDYITRFDQTSDEIFIQYVDVLMEFEDFASKYRKKLLEICLRLLNNKDVNEKLRIKAIEVLGKLGDFNSCIPLVRYFDSNELSEDLTDALFGAFDKISKQVGRKFKTKEEVIIKTRILISSNILFSSENQTLKNVIKALRTLSDCLIEPMIQFETEERFKKIPVGKLSINEIEYVGKNFILNLLLHYGLKASYEQDFSHISVLEALLKIDWTKSLFFNELKYSLFDHAELEEPIMAGLALENLARIGQERTIPIVYKQLQNPLEPARFYAIRALRNFSSDIIDINVIMQRFLQETSRWVKAEYINLFCRWQLVEALPELLNLYSQNTPLEIKRLILEAFVEYAKSAKLSEHNENLLSNFAIQVILQPIGDLSLDFQSIFMKNGLKILFSISKVRIDDKIVQLFTQSKEANIRYLYLEYFEEYIDRVPPLIANDTINTLLLSNTLNEQEKSYILFFKQDIDENDIIDQDLLDEFQISKPESIDLGNTSYPKLSKKEAKSFEQQFDEILEKTEEPNEQNQIELDNFIDNNLDNLAGFVVQMQRNQFIKLKKLLVSIRDSNRFQSLIISLLHNEKVKKKGKAIMKITMELLFDVFRERPNFDDKKFIIRTMYSTQSKVTRGFLFKMLEIEELDESIAIMLEEVLLDDYNKEPINVLKKNIMESFVIRYKVTSYKEQEFILNAFKFLGFDEVVGYYEEYLLENSLEQLELENILGLLLFFNKDSSKRVIEKIKNESELNEDLKKKIEEVYYKSLLKSSEALKTMLSDSEFTNIALALENWDLDFSFESGFLLYELLQVIQGIKNEKPELEILSQIISMIHLKLEKVFEYLRILPAEFYKRYIDVKISKEYIISGINSKNLDGRTLIFNYILSNEEDYSTYNSLPENIRNQLEELYTNSHAETFESQFAVLIKELIAKPPTESLAVNLASIFYKITLYHYQHTDYNLALQTINLSLSLDPFREEFYYLGASINKLLNFYESAISLCDEGLNIFPNSVELQNLKLSIEHLTNVPLEYNEELFHSLLLALNQQDSEMFIEYLAKILVSNLNFEKDLPNILYLVMEFTKIADEEKRKVLLEELQKHESILQNPRFAQLNIQELLDYLKGEEFENKFRIWNYELLIYLIREKYGDIPQTLAKKQKLAKLLNDYALELLDLDLIHAEYPDNLELGIKSQREKAIELLKEALMLDSFNPIIAQNIAITYLQLMQDEKDSFKKQLWSDKSSQYLDQAYFLFELNKDHDDEKRKRFFALKKQYADFLLEFGDENRANLIYKEILQSYPDIGLKAKLLNSELEKISSEKTSHKIRKIFESSNMHNFNLIEKNFYNLEYIKKNLSQTLNSTLAIGYLGEQRQLLNGLYLEDGDRQKIRQGMSILEKILILPFDENEEGNTIRQYVFEILTQSHLKFIENDSARYYITVLKMYFPTDLDVLTLNADMEHEALNLEGAIGWIDRAYLLCKNFTEEKPIIEIREQYKKELEIKPYFIGYKKGFQLFTLQKFQDAEFALRDALAFKADSITRSKIINTLPAEMMYLYLLVAVKMQIEKKAESIANDDLFGELRGSLGSLSFEPALRSFFKYIGHYKKDIAPSNRDPEIRSLIKQIAEAVKTYANQLNAFSGEFTTLSDL